MDCSIALMAFIFKCVYVVLKRCSRFGLCGAVKWLIPQCYTFSFSFHIACVCVWVFNNLNRKPQNYRPFKRRAKFVVQPNIQLIIKFLIVRTTCIAPVYETKFCVVRFHFAFFFNV